MTCSLVLFAKPPLPGIAKTRLASDLGPESAAAVAEALLLDTVLLCEQVVLGEGHGSPQRVLAYASHEEWFQARLSDTWRLIPQGEGNLDARLDAALRTLDPAPSDRTVFVGMDAPHLPASYCAEGFSALAGRHTVLGACEDGGYYLVGVRGRWQAGTLGEVRWSTEHALADTLNAFEGSGLTGTVLPEWYDVDELASLRRLLEELPGMPPAALPHLREAVQRLNL